MKKKFITVISLLLALIMSFALIACGDDDRRGVGDGGDNTPPDISAAMTKLLTSDGLTGSLVWSFDADAEAMTAQVEKRGDKINVVYADDEEVIFDISTGYLYYKESAGYYFEQKLPANSIDYAAYMIGKQFEGVDLTQLEDDPHIAYDKSTRTVTIAYDEAERINTLLAPLYSAYKSNATVLTMLNEYLKLVSPNQQYPLTVDSVLTLLILWVKTNPDATVGDFIAFAKNSGLDVYETIEQMGIPLDDDMKKAIEARKVSDLILAMYGMAKSFIPSATTLDETGSEGEGGSGGATIIETIDFGAIFEALFVKPVESKDINADLEDAKTVVLAGLNLIRVQRDIVDKYLGTEDATPEMRELYAAIKNQVEIEKLNSSLSLVFDNNNDIAEIKANAAFKHDYDGDTEGFKYLSQNDFYFAFDLTIDSYTAEGTEFAIDFAENASILHSVTAIAYGEVADEIPVYYEIGDKQLEITPTLTSESWMTYNAETHTFVIDINEFLIYRNDLLVSNTFDGTIIGTASIAGDETDITVILRIMPDDPQEALPIIFEYIESLRGGKDSPNIGIH